MNIVYASTYLHLLLFVFSAPYNFPSAGVLHSWFGLFLGILSNAIVNGIIFLISLSVCYWYIKWNYLWILILYSATLLNSFIHHSAILVESLGLSMYSMMPSANDSFTSSLTVWMLSISSSSCLIAVARASSTMLKKRGESRHPSLSFSQS